MSAHQAPDEKRDEKSEHGRRAMVRTLLGGGAAAALTGAARPAAAAPTPRPRARHQESQDPFAADTFKANGRVREYWIQADSFEHNTVPTGYDAMMGRHISGQTTFQAVGFRAYTPGWHHPLDADLGPDGVGPNQGIPGPVLRAEVGDLIRVHFRNNDDHYRWPHSMHPHGVLYNRDNDGAWVADDPDRPGAAVPFGQTYTYTWACPPSSVGTWPYHDHSMPQSIPAPTGAGGNSVRKEYGLDEAQRLSSADPVMEIGAELGLLGVLAVTDEQTPKVDREFVLFLHDVYKADIPSLGQNLNLFNGAAFLGNTPTFTAKTGDRVRWRIASLGQDFHVFHLHGHRWPKAPGFPGFLDSQLIGPSTTLTIEYLEDNPGDWLYHCHVVHHMMGGMVGRYQVT
ncbi:multicopper oxidase domain-containing protein [Kitasatospora kifunensis]|uniref:FtsP/CotA-like multicopper oxidase with cupredoxin domain n=1 Tax=Kitasatospora kifunensis TaxID=58351 RepID=A0A7W7R8U7_KITKI|nr:multicopper oxidase domain-containing protein [Kitasatospora kifunensis]MBB4927248.1 FtsP/CotA-like multicopper oxidase with cupredoxin domain [Kitasatospora kifunensis]